MTATVDMALPGYCRSLGAAVTATKAMVHRAHLGTRTAIQCPCADGAIAICQCWASSASALDQ